MPVSETSVFIPAMAEQGSLLDYFAKTVDFRLGKNGIPIRFGVSETTDEGFSCEIGLIDNHASVDSNSSVPSVFEFQKRAFENQSSFNAVLLIPTGIGCEIGGHAGDATPVAHLLAQNCDHLVLHPNAVNASDINEAPKNSLYCEGSIVTRLLMGTIGLRPVRNNRLLVIYDGDHDPVFMNATQNSVNGARAVYGIDCVDLWQMEEPVKMLAAYTDTGRAAGSVNNLDKLLKKLKNHRDEYDAVAISSVVDVSEGTLTDYFQSEGEMVNPWGGVEALLTHTISTLLNVPSAHSPMMESQEVAAEDLGVVDPRLGAEAVSMTFMNCMLKGLQRAPQIVADETLWGRDSVISASDISCLVIPDGCVGLPTLAALEQGIRVIAVRENKNLMKNDLEDLPWKDGQLFIVENYWEAAGVMSALKAGLDPMTMRRPLAPIVPNIIKSDVAEDNKSDTGTG